MKPLIETLNLWGGNALQLVWPVLWQSSLLIGLLFGLDLVLRRRVRAAVRYALWLVVLVKLLLPPALAFPTGLGWWLRPVAHPGPEAASASFVVSYGPGGLPGLEVPAAVIYAPPPRVTLSASGAALVGSATVSLGLLIWMLVRWRRLARDVGNAAVAPAGLQELLAAGGRLLGLRRAVQLRLTERPMSPAVCGLVRPVILLPRSLPEQLEPSQLRAVLLHELIHLRRGDVWVNCVQALVQMVYWWHPLLWVANARIRHVREEAVDDAVMIALRGEADSYAPTLLEVAKLALPRRVASLGLVGILESRRALRSRIERLLDFRPPRTARLTLGSLGCILAFAAVAVPMGPAPEKRELTTTNSGPASVSSADGAFRDPWGNPYRVTFDANGQGSQSSSATPIASSNLHARTFRMDYAKVREALGADGLAFEEHLLPLSEALRNLFKQNGVELSPPKSLYYNLGHDYLFVRATPEDLAVIEKLVAPLQRPPSTDILPRTFEVDINALIAHVRSALGRSQTAGPNFSTPEQSLAALLQARGLAFSHLSLDERRGVLWLAATKEQADAIAAQPELQSASAVGNLPTNAGSASMENRGSPTELFTRRFRIDAGKFLWAMGRTTGGLPLEEHLPVVSKASEWFRAKGVDLSPPKSLFFNEGLSYLFVRATQGDLDLVERLIQDTQSPANSEASTVTSPSVHAINTGLPIAAPGPAKFLRPQINIKATLLELPEAEAAAFRTRFPVTNTPGAGNWEVLLSAAQVAEELAQWKAGQGDILSSPQILTLSGRRAEIFIGETLPVLVRTNSTTATNQVETGIRLGVVPMVSADGWTVAMDITTSLTEFTGYAKGTNGENCPVPQFRMVKMATHASVPDHQALVLGGPVSEKISTIQEKTPVLGDIPLLAGLFRSKTSSTRRSCLFVLLTPTLVDEEGNLVHAR